MNIVGYDIIQNNNRILVFLKVEEYPSSDGKLSYKSLNNIIYKINDGYCVTDKRGVPLIVRDDLELCGIFLNHEYEKTYTVNEPLILHTDEL